MHKLEMYYVIEIESFNEVCIFDLSLSYFHW